MRCDISESRLRDCSPEVPRLFEIGAINRYPSASTSEWNGCCYCLQFRLEPESCVMTQRLESFGLFWLLIGDSSHLAKDSCPPSQNHATYHKIMQPIKNHTTYQKSLNLCWVFSPKFITEKLVIHESESFFLEFGKRLVMTPVFSQRFKSWLKSKKINRVLAYCDSRNWELMSQHKLQFSRELQFAN